MMSDTQILGEMMHAEATHEYRGSSAKLSEPQAKDHSVVIEGIPGDAVIIKADQFPPPRRFLKGSKDERRRADYVIISESEKKIVYIELKMSLPYGERRESIVTNQLRGARCVVAYCQEMGRMFWGKGKFLSGYKDCYVCLTHMNLAKSRTRIDQNDRNYPHRTPEKAQYVFLDKVPYNRLAP